MYRSEREERFTHEKRGSKRILKGGLKGRKRILHGKKKDPSRIVMSEKDPLSVGKGPLKDPYERPFPEPLNFPFRASKDPSCSCRVRRL
jgi:hypothetical protein